MKQTITLIIIVFFISQGTAQFSMGVQASYLTLTGGDDISNIGAGIRVEKVVRDKTAFIGGFNYFKTSTFADKTTLRASDSSTNPSQIEVSLDYDISFLYFYIGGKRYLVGDYDKSFNLYVDVEAGLLMAPTTAYLGEYDKSLYTTFREDVEKETLSNLTIGVGLGVEQSIGFGYLYASAKILLPANESNGVNIGYEIPTSFMYTAGLRVPFGS